MTREEAISIMNVIVHMLEPQYDTDHIENAVEMAIKALEQEPKTGHWIEIIDEIDSLGNKTWHHKCSICGNENSGWGNYKYCPQCGAKMESEVEK